jgi:outer membrane immunogenic protein
MRISMLAGMALAVATLASPVLANDAPFTGATVSARLGYDNINLGGFDASGVQYGVGVGYDFAVSPNVRLGVLGNVDFSSADVNGRVGLETFNISAKRDLEAGVRLGYVVSPAALLYAKTSYANVAATGTTNLLNILTSSQSDTSSAFRMGAGAEFAVTKAFFVGAGYDHTFGDRGGNRDRLTASVGVRF